MITRIRPTIACPSTRPSYLIHGRAPHPERAFGRIRRANNFPYPSSFGRRTSCQAFARPRPPQADSDGRQFDGDRQASDEIAVALHRIAGRSLDDDLSAADDLDIGQAM